MLFSFSLHASERKNHLPDGLYYIQGDINPQRNKNNKLILSYRPESDGEVYFKINNGSVIIYYYQSDYYWIVGRAESTYDVKFNKIIVKNIIETKHTQAENITIGIGDEFPGNIITQEKSELIPISGITNNGFVINCDKYTKENNISAFSFPEHYILSAEDNYCSRAYNDNGTLVHLNITVKKIQDN